MDFFKIKERGSDVRTEIFAGITTFFAMCYIVVVNPNQGAAGGAAAGTSHSLPPILGRTKYLSVTPV